MWPTTNGDLAGFLKGDLSAQSPTPRLYHCTSTTHLLPKFQFYPFSVAVQPGLCWTETPKTDFVRLDLYYSYFCHVIAQKFCLFQKMNMKLPKSLRDKDPMLSSLPTVDSAMEYSNHEWTTEELDAVDTQVLII